jgi:D-alanyl-D-alanine carboxypeptidase/D-alanyl-D-alanine-endopeptidase (penicillin-binding protein 4)
VLIGDGDPSLQVADLSALARQTAAATDLAGVRRLVVDDSAFSERRFGPGYDEGGPGLSYMAPSGALSLQFNTIEITVQRTELGRPLAVSVSPACDHVEIVSTAVTGRGHLSVTTSQRDGRTVVRVAGGTRAKVQRFRRRIYDPGMFTASVFARALSRASGIEVLPVERGVADGNQELVAVHRSAPLAEVLESTLKFSNNFTAEQLVRTLGRHMSDRPGDWSNGLEALRRYSQALSLVDRDSLRFENASGLSATGRATARSLVDLLTHAARSERDVHELLEALPVAGREGTLHHRLHGTGGRVRAKTGTLADALALSGVVYDRHGRPRWGFSILVNAAKDRGRARKIQDAMVRLLVEHSDTLAGRG